MTDLTKCNQRPECANPPVYRFTWPGCDEAAICNEHAGKLRTVADVLGLHVQLIPLEESE